MLLPYRPSRHCCFAGGHVKSRRLALRPLSPEEPGQSVAQGVHGSPHQRLSSRDASFPAQGGAMLTLMLAVALLFIRPNVDFRAAETGRIRRHLATVEAELRAKDISALTPAQRQARAKNLDVLHAYWA